MADNFNTRTTDATKDEWLTPPSLLAAVGPFDLDPCAPPQERRPWSMAARHISLPENGLKADWGGYRVWCNPPYGKETFVWLEKLATHGDGIALIFARTETKGFHRQIWEKANAIFFFEGRIKFFHSDGTPGQMPNAASCLVAYGDRNAAAIHKAHARGLIKGHLILLREDRV
jgi:DNA N-6-adenine-methyltransferase (Dam)